MKAHGLNPRIKKSPFFEKAVEYGATEFHPYNGMWMPVGYDSPVNEYWNVLERASLWDVGVQKCVEIAGPDAEAFMQLLTPRHHHDRARRCAHVFLTNQDGGVLNDLSCCESLKTGSGCRPPTPTCTSGPRVSRVLGHESRSHPARVPDAVAGAEVGRDHGRRSSVRRSSTFVTTGGCAARSTASMSSSRVPVTAPSSATRCISSAKRGGELWEILMTAGKPYGIRPAHPTASAASKAAYSTTSDITPDENPLNSVLIDSSWDTDFLGKAAPEGARRRVRRA